ncbi:MFS transporter [Corynebacterium lowii]|uniref:Multidrug resistance protein stp n=1 Tax=Corynebacterium lowii TaxID=1544413 RepID=A0A0Q0UJJ0_9CORY|nr:MFS transporter [Corynebacterium lowii]KQB86395.1 Multidrug resistance protein stp [Corynebacterium lowii]MDP9850880.1 EmrB/QacA subfamily drug resistance transporter [Corynebacterium lowii]
MVSAAQAYRALAALCIGFFMILMDQTIVAVATPHIQQELHASLSQVVWVTSIYLLFYVVPLLLSGRLGDRYGQRNVYRVGMVVFVGASIVCGLAPTIEVLIAARAVQGLGASILTPQTMSVINRIFPKERRGTALGIWGAVAGLATLAGPMLGGIIVASLGWHWIFFINVPLGVLSLVLVSLWVPDLPRTTSRIHGGSVVLFLLGLSAVVFSLQQGFSLGWPWWLWLLLGVGLLCLVVFVWWQHRVSDPLMPLALFAQRNFALGAFSIATVGLAVTAQMLPIMVYLQQGRGLDPERAGLMMVPMALVSGVLSPLVGRATDKIAPRVLSVTGFSAFIAALVVLSVEMALGHTSWGFSAAVALMGVGSALVWAPNSATSMREVPVNLMGAASGVYNTTRQVGAVLGTALVGAVMQVSAAHYDVGVAMGLSLLVPAAALLLGLCAVSFFPGTAPQNRS